MIGSDFRVIDPDAIDQRAHLTAHGWIAVADHLAGDLCSLVDSAALFFVGIFPFESPFMLWGRSISLPWSQQFEAAGTRDAAGVVISWNIAPLVREVIERLRIDSSQDVRPALSKGEMTRDFVQTLAVYVMLAADRGLDALQREDYRAAAEAISTAYRYLVECTCQAQLALEILPTERSRRALDVQHIENRDSKRMVFEWLDAHVAHPPKHGALQAASAAIVNARLVVQTPKTIRNWCTEWNQLRASDTAE